MIDFGTVKPGQTLYCPFDSFSGGTGAPTTISGFAVGDILIYKDGSTTQRASTSGFTLLDTDGIDFDGITGINGFSIDLADNTTSGFYAAGSRYFIVISTITVDSQTVSFVYGTFRIGFAAATLDTTIATLTNQTSFTLTSGPAEDDALNGMWAIIHDAASAVQETWVQILDYVGSTKTVTLAAAGTFAVAAGDNFSVMGVMPLQPTVLGRTADVTSTGGVGIDWGNVENQSTSVNLSATTTNLVNTATTVTNQLTAAQIATGIWQDSTAGDFTVASSIGKALYINNVAPGGSGGHLISGANSGTTTLGALTVTGATTLTGNVSMAAGLNISQSSPNTSALMVTGSGIGHGAVFVSGAGATGNAIQITANSNSGHGINITGAGGGDGVRSTAGTNGNGMTLVGGSTSGDGLHAQATTLGRGVHFTGVGGLEGIRVECGSTGTGVAIIGGTVTGSAIAVTGPVSLSSTLTVTGETTLTGAVTATNASNDIRGVLLQATQTGVTIPTVTTVGTVNALANDSVTAAAIAADAGVEIGTAVWASATRTLTSLSGLTADCNLAQILGTAVTEGAAGRLAASFTTLLDVASPVFTVASVNQTGDSFARIGATGSGLTSLAPASTALSTATWTNTLATNLGTTNTTVATNLDATISSRMASFTLPTNFSVLAITAGGEVTAASVTAGVSLATGALTDTAIATSGANRIADTTRRRTQANVEASSYGDALSVTSLYGFIQQAQESNTTTTPGSLSIYQTDGTTLLGTRALTSDASAEPVTGVS